METRKIDYKFIKKCMGEVRDGSEWVKGARQEHWQSSSSDEYNPTEKKRKGHLLEVTIGKKQQYCTISSSSLMEYFN